MLLETNRLSRWFLEKKGALFSHSLSPMVQCLGLGGAEVDMAVISFATSGLFGHKVSSTGLACVCEQ